MPKRPNPFGDSSPLQFKSHISVKKIDMGVAQEAKMQTVYDNYRPPTKLQEDRTKEMLFAGAKKVTFARRLSVDIDPPPKPLPGQLRLDVGGHVCNKQVIPMDGGFGGGVNGGDFRFEMSVDSMTNGFHNNNNCLAAPLTGQLQIDSSGRLCAGTKVPQPSPVLPNSCQICNRHLGQSVVSCNFCERRLCSGCIRPCANCQGSYCHLCSVTNYEDISEKAFCLHCAS